METKKYIFVDNYGEMLAQVNGMELISFETDGGYQGDYLAVLKAPEESYPTLPERLFYFIDSYGSCSGCDWLEAEGNNFSYSDEDEVYKEKVNLNKNYAVLYKDAVAFCAGLKPKFITQATQPLKFTKAEYNGFSITN